MTEEGTTEDEIPSKVEKISKMRLIRAIMNNDSFVKLVIKLNLDEISLNKFFLFISTIEIIVDNNLC